MANDLTTTTDGAAGHRDPAWKALSLLFSPIDTVMAELGDGAGSAIDAALAKTDVELRAVPEGGPGRAEWSDALDERLRRLAAKVLPTAGAGADAWREALLEALSDLPAMVALTAAKRAIHTPFRFIGEIEVEVRRIATDMIDKRHVRRARLLQMRAELTRGASPGPALSAHAELTPAMIRAMPASIVRMGLAGGFLTQDEINAAMAEQDEVAA